MNGMDVVRHGIDMLLRNLGPALRVSAGPVLIAFLVTAVLGALGLGAALGPGADFSQPAGIGAGWGFTLFVGTLLAMLLWLFVLSWVAVAWHRYILLEEQPGLLPPLRSDLVWPYLGRTVLLALLLILLAIPVSIVAGFLLYGAGPENLVAVFVVQTVLSLLLGWVAMRLSLVLPARALDRPLRFGESWAATAPVSGAIFVVVLVLAVINAVLALLFGAMGDNLVTVLLSLAVQWFTAMLGLSVLTTLYGALIERRTLAA